MKKNTDESFGMSRRDFVRSCAAGAAGLVSSSSLLARTVSSGRLAVRSGSTHRTIPLDQGWLFGGKLNKEGLEPGFNDAGFERVNLPHCVAKLSWQKWDPADWEAEWLYRRHFVLPQDVRDQRIFVHFDGVMVGATPVVNGHALPEHLGGYLPIQYEITHLLSAKENVLAVAIDSRWSNTPPEGSPRGPISVDYLEPGGIVRPVSLRAAPQVFINDVFAKPVKVLDSEWRVEIECSIDAATVPAHPVRVEATMMGGPRVVACASRSLRIEKAGETNVALALEKLGNVKLWSPDSPNLYDVRATLSASNKTLHEYRTRIGLRDACFELNGFSLNGRRFRVFGLDRHELFPYVSFAMPHRVLHRDAELIRHTFNCNFVRCSHYPQSEAFVEACNELGLMIWEELPGWQYLGDSAWQERALRDVQGMVRRDRNHPAVAIWGVRINESRNDPELCRKTKRVADALDGSRPTSGTMTPRSTRNYLQHPDNWLQDVFAYDDYHAKPDGSVDIAKSLPGATYANINGSRDNQTSYSLDGANYLDQYYNVNIPFPFPDALQEFSLTGRWYKDHIQYVPQNPTCNLLGYQSGYDQPVNNIMIQETHTFRSNLLNQASFTFSNVPTEKSFTSDSPNVASFGVTGLWLPADKWLQNIQISGAFSINGGAKGPFNNKNYGFQDNLSWVVGRHNLDLGMSYAHSIVNLGDQYLAQGAFSFNASVTNNELASFMLGYLRTFRQGYGEYKNNRNNFWAFYITDSFHATRRLTLNYGIRYELYFPWREIKGRSEVFSPANYYAGVQSQQFVNAPPGLLFPGDKGVPFAGVTGNYTNFAPRVGFAYDLTGNGRTSIRGGAGFFYDSGTAGVFNNRFADISPFSPQVTLTPAPVTHESASWLSS